MGWQDSPLPVRGPQVGRRPRRQALIILSSLKNSKTVKLKFSTIFPEMTSLEAAIGVLRHSHASPDRQPHCREGDERWEPHGGLGHHHGDLRRHQRGSEQVSHNNVPA